MNPGFVFHKNALCHYSDTCTDLTTYFFTFLVSEEYAQFYGAMNTMRQGGMVTMRKDGLPYDEMGYCPPPNRHLIKKSKFLSYKLLI